MRQERHCQFQISIDNLFCSNHKTNNSFFQAFKELGFHRVQAINLQSYKPELDRSEDEILQQKLKADIQKLFNSV